MKRAATIIREQARGHTWIAHVYNAKKAIEIVDNRAEKLDHLRIIMTMN